MIYNSLGEGKSEGKSLTVQTLQVCFVGGNISKFGKRDMLFFMLGRAGQRKGLCRLLVKWEVKNTMEATSINCKSLLNRAICCRWGISLSVISKIYIVINLLGS